jgi:hypothetical protein
LYSCTNRRWRACTQFVLLPQRQQAALVLLHEQTMESVHAVRTTPTEAASSTCTPARTDDGEGVLAVRSTRKEAAENTCAPARTDDGKGARSSYNSLSSSKQDLCSCTNRRWRACTQFLQLAQKQQAAPVLLHEQTMERVPQFLQLTQKQHLVWNVLWVRRTPACTEGALWNALT